MSPDWWSAGDLVANQCRAPGCHDSAAADREASRVSCDCSVATRCTLLLLAGHEGMRCCTRWSDRPDENLLPEAAKIQPLRGLRGRRQKAEQSRGRVYLWCLRLGRGGILRPDSGQLPRRQRRKTIGRRGCLTHHHRMRWSSAQTCRDWAVATTCVAELQPSSRLSASAMLLLASAEIYPRFGLAETEGISLVVLLPQSTFVS